MSDEKSSDAVLREHAGRAGEVIDGADRRSLHRLYQELADDLSAAVGDDGDVPLLSFPETAVAVADALAGTTGTHLDAGCGPNPRASLMIALHERRLVVGMDVGLAMVTMARRVAAEAGVDFLGVVADLERLPFRDAAFGSVVCDDTIEHVPDDATAVAELSRVTRPDGRVALATPNRHRLDVVARKVRDIATGRRRPATSYYAATSHLREYTPRGLASLVSPWFQVIARGHVPWPGDGARGWASRLTRRGPLRTVERVLLFVLRPQTEHHG